MRTRPLLPSVVPPAVLLAVLLSGCAPAERQRPEAAAVAAPAAWLAGATGNATVAPTWWRAFGDPVLERLVEQALARNTDVLGAAARVQEAQANVALARSAMLPSLNIALGAQRGRSLGAAGTATSTALQPEAQVSWQADLFGRLGQLRQAARLQYVASQADRDAIALSVASGVAQAYIGLLALDARLNVSLETVESRKEALRLASDQAEVGYISEYELTQAQAEYAAVEQAIPQLRQAIAAQENALRRLTGDLPGPVERGASLRTLQLPAVPATLPSELLRNRPDIRSVELTLAAADVGLGAARKAFLPQVALSASLGQLFTNALDYDPVTVWNLGGSILAPIFNGGRLNAQMDVATAQRDQVAYAYRGVVLAAFQDVETALTGAQRLAEQFDRALERREILLRTTARATDRYRSGYASYLEQLDAQRGLYSTELDAIGIREDQLNNIVELYRALGGGWRGAAEKGVQ
jgi:NodT family efflux transporter outer membrane factor (OMF) lipoprotein